MKTDEECYRLPWMTGDQWACANFWAQIMRGWHHIGGHFKECGSGIKIYEPYGNFATFDYDNLTRLVFLAHEKMVRVEIRGGTPGRVCFILHQRHTREGDMAKRHPTIQEAIERFKG